MRLLVTGGSGFIGTNTIEAFLGKGHSILNFSLDPPLNPEHNRFWHRGDILDLDAISTASRNFAPDHVLHLAARADCDEHVTVAEGYQANTDGTRNVLHAVAETASVLRCVITSSQFVCAPGRLPMSDTDYFPETVYGESKVITEQLTREASLDCCWTIIRPTNVWGPWHMRYRREFWRVVQAGLYVHPGRQPVVRSYGYVENVVDQILRILAMPVDQVHRRTLYLGDRPIDLFGWVNDFSLALRGRAAHVVPRSVMRALALVGDVPTTLTGKPFFINSSRFRSMITDYETPMEETFQLLGENPFTRAEGVARTVAWLQRYSGAEVSGGGA